jgi:1,3-beta-glucan synthase
LTFYYGHPGFHVNNILITASLQVFMLTLAFLGTLKSTLPLCKYNASGELIAGQSGCYGLNPVFDWMNRSIIAIFLFFFIAFLPLFLTELVENGAGRAFLRVGKQIASLGPIFEVFSTQIYSHSILSNLNFGGARYIATGRGFATTRISFSILYSRFAGASIYFGMRTLLILFYASITIWLVPLIYFWFLVISLCIAPFVFNPHQFSIGDFIIDYREYLRWMSRGNSKWHANSWIGYCRVSRTMITGFKKKRLGKPSEKLSTDVPRAGWRTVLFAEIFLPVVLALVFIVAYMFVKAFPQNLTNPPPSALVRIGVVALAPIVWNAAILLIIFLFSVILGPMLGGCCAQFGSVMASIAHFLALLGLIGCFEFFWFLELWDFSHAVLGLTAIVFIQRAIYKSLIAIFLTREFKHDETNRAWWTGRWWDPELGKGSLSNPAREFIVKIIELSLWSGDLLMGHLLLLILTLPALIPYFDKIHAMMLFWLRPSRQIHAPLYSLKQKRQRRGIILKYGLVFILMMGFFLALIILPLIFRDSLNINCSLCRLI